MLSEQEMLMFIHKVYPNWKPTTPDKNKRFGQIKALYFRVKCILNSSGPLYGEQTNEEANENEQTEIYEQTTMEGF